MDNLKYNEIPELEPIKNYILNKSVWIIGGDGWSYDIGFGGLDHVMSSNEIARLIEQKTGIETRATILGHVQRGGSPTVRDRVEASLLGYYAVELLERGVGNRVVGKKDDKVVDYDIQDALQMKKNIDMYLYNIATFMEQ